MIKSKKYRVELTEAEVSMIFHALSDRAMEEREWDHMDEAEDFDALAEKVLAAKNR